MFFRWIVTPCACGSRTRDIDPDESRHNLAARFDLTKHFDRPPIPTTRFEIGSNGSLVPLNANFPRPRTSLDGRIN